VIWETKGKNENEDENCQMGNTNLARRYTHTLESANGHSWKSWTGKLGLITSV